MNTDFLYKHSNATISLAEIEANLQFENQKELYILINKYIANGILSPYGKATTARTPAVHLKYRIHKPENPDVLSKLQTIKLLDTQYYLKHINEVEGDYKYLVAINNYFAQSLPTDIELSVNERSLLIFNDEKFLSSKNGKKILSKINLSIDDFNIYYTPEIFMYFRNNSKSGNVLIIENKDTWTTFKKNLIKNKSIFGLEFDAIIFGEGKKIINSFAFIRDEEFNHFNSKENTFYYFGDVDSSGISILYSLMQKYSDYNIVPFMLCYNILFSNIDKYSHIKYHDDETQKNDSCITIDKISYCFPKVNHQQILNFCKENKIIPQEVVNNEILMKGEITFA